MSDKKPNSNLVLLLLLVVAAFAIIGLAVYSFTNTPRKPEPEITTSSSSKPIANVYQFSDGLMRLNYALPKQTSYGERNVSILDHECFEVSDYCAPLDFIEKQPAEWLITYNHGSRVFALNQDSYSISFSLVPYRALAARRLGCDELCGVSALITVHRVENELSLDETVAEMNKIRLAEEPSGSPLDPTVTILEKLTMFDTLAYKLNVPEFYAVSETHEVYIARNADSLYYVDVYVNDDTAREKITQVLNSFKFID